MGEEDKGPVCLGREMDNRESSGSPRSGSLCKEQGSKDEASVGVPNEGKELSPKGKPLPPHEPHTSPVYLQLSEVFCRIPFGGLESVAALRVAALRNRFGSKNLEPGPKVVLVNQKTMAPLKTLMSKAS